MIKAFFALCLVIGMGSEVVAQTTRSYDASGRISGQAVRSGNTIRYYDQSGKMIAYEIINGKTVTKYDANGHIIGVENR